jgi:1-acyl-sn-glycerol-3-phosphate acyltransferase
MFIGIGTLAFARHPAMRSLGNVTIIGMISVVIISFIIPPLLYNYLTYKNGNKRLMPITIWGIVITLYCFCCFLIGCLAITVYGFFKLALSKPTEKKKLKYHQVMMKVSRFITKNIPLVSNEVINKYGEDFEKPAVIICNHQSHLDLIYIMMLSPKLIILTNEWVWHSPFYGQLIRYADFYPVANGIENSIDRLSSIVQRGYSIVIFPEGTRSEDCSILRFHKGAFYLAEKLKLDIIPIVVHGIGHALPKKELLLRKGKVTMNILKRVTIDATTYGASYVERAKQFRKLYKQEYALLAQREETPDYFSNVVFHNYIYKGGDLDKQARKQLKKFKNFEPFISLLPSSGNALVADCGIGVFALMAALVKKQVQFMAIDQNQDNVDLGVNCASKPQNLGFALAGINDVNLSEYDYVALVNPADVFLVEKCASTIPTYMLIEKRNLNFEAITHINNAKVIGEGKNVIIIFGRYE